MLHVWYIYLQNWVIWFGQMLGFAFQHHDHMGYETCPRICSKEKCRIKSIYKPWFPVEVALAQSIEKGQCFYGENMAFKPMDMGTPFLRQRHMLCHVWAMIGVNVGKYSIHDPWSIWESQSKVACWKIPHLVR